MNKDTFFKDTFILTLSNLTTGILGFIFSVILSKYLGAEGMGLYGLVMPIYNLFCCLICGGMVTALSKISAIYFSNKDFKNLNKSIEASLLFDFIWGILVSIVVIFTSTFISNFIIKDSRTVYSLWTITPALLFVALSSILKGYFYGISKVTIPAVIDIVEKTIRIVVLVTIIDIFMFGTVKDAVLFAYISLAIGELISFILLYICYKLYKNRPTLLPSKSEGRAQLLFNILVISFPLCLNGFLSTAISSASTLLIPRRLVSTGILYSDALALIGKFSGMALNITFFPIIIIGSIITILIPDLSQSLNKKDFTTLENRIAQVLKIAFLLGIATLIICFTSSEALGKLFYNRNDLGIYIRYAALSAPLAYCSVTTYGILNGLGKQGILLRNSLFVSILELILLYVLTGIPSINIFGYALSLFITSLTSISLNLIEIKKNCYLNLSILDIIISLLIGILSYYILIGIQLLFSNNYFVLKQVTTIILGFTLVFGLRWIVDSKKT